MLRGSGVAAVAAIPLVLLVPSAAALAIFVLLTIWTHGPLAVFMPAAYEPLLMLYGKLYSPWLVALIGTVADLYVEYVDYLLFRAMYETRIGRQALDRPAVTRVLGWFERAPFVTTWIVALTPLPDWPIRLIAPAAGYSVSRYLLAMALGRFPNFFFFAAVGEHLDLPAPVALAAGLFALLLTLVLVLRRRGTKVHPEEAVCTP